MNCKRISKFALPLFLIFGLVGCENRTKEVSQTDVKGYFSHHRVGSSPDYAVMKNGSDYLATIHGFMDDQSVCTELIEKYNRNVSLSVLPGRYTCVQLNQ
jgi:hypothetical protein